MRRAARKLSRTLSVRLLKLAAGIVSCCALLAGWLAGCKGVEGIFSVAYGPASARYTVRGTVRAAETGAAIPGIRVRVEYRAGEDGERLVSMKEAVADSAGGFRIRQSENPRESVWTLRAEDIDGAANGEYRETVISHAAPEGAQSNADTLYTVDVRMEEKKDGSR